MGTDCPSPDHLLMTQTAEICRSSWHSGRRVGLGLPAVEVMTFGVIYEWVVEDSNKYENIIYIYIYYTVHTFQLKQILWAKPLSHQTFTFTWLEPILLAIRTTSNQKDK